MILQMTLNICIFEDNLKGNIYLARVTRVETSLKQLLLNMEETVKVFSFSEIHPDYYRIPVEDKTNLVEVSAKADEEFHPMKMLMMIQQTIIMKN